jgi:uncharacterized protein YqeY
VSGLKAKMMEDLKAAMKGGDKVKLSTIRQIQSTVKNKEIDNRVVAVDPNDKRTQEQKDDDMIISILKTLVKQRKDSIEQFTAGGRADLVAQEEAELKIVESYLPQMMSRDQIESIVAQAISDTKASSAKDMGLVMKAVMAKTQGLADGKVISEVVKSKLQ